jgi:flagellar basal-body rod modification protein FlgD
MTSISTVGTATTSTVTGADGTEFSAGADRTAMDTNVFLKLMMAQLQYQDPSNPADSSQFLAQTAQFTSVEKMQQLTDMQQEMLDATRGQTATSLVGRTVTYTDFSGTSQTGMVTACTLGAGTPNLTVGGITVGLDAVTGVSGPDTADASGPA